MIAQALEVYKELDPAKKDYKWADKCVTNFRIFWRPIIDPVRASRNRHFLLSTFDMEKVKAKFSDIDFLKNTEFIPIATFEKLRNIIITEIYNNPPKAELKAIDPSAIQDKKDDLMLLQHRDIVEADVNAAQKAVDATAPPYKVGYDKYNSNVQDFDQMGLDNKDQSDVNFYAVNHQRLYYEVMGQSLLNSIFEVNKFAEYTTKFVNDILAGKVMCKQAFVSKTTGEIKYRYLYPEICKGILGTRSDNADAKCLGWEDGVSIGEFLEQVGDDFNWDRDWRQLLWALNYRNVWKYTGFIRNGITYDTCLDAERGLYNYPTEQCNLCNFESAYNFEITMGYIEWKSWDADTYKIKKDESQMFPVNFDYKITENSSYKKTSWYKQVNYSAIFLATGTTSQKIFCFGKVYHQTSDGQYDEYAGYTLSYYREEGLSAVEIAIPYLRLANDAFYKMVWAVDKAKPDSDVFWLDEMIEVTKGMDKLAGETPGVIPVAGGNAGFQNKLMQIIKFEKERAIKIRTYPKPNGTALLNPPSTNDKKQNGLDPVAIAMQAVVAWAEDQISDKWGINALREGFSPDPKDGYKINEAAAQSSRNATGYIERMISHLMTHTATITLLYAQDIIKYKDSLPYKWILNLSSLETISALEQLDKCAAHRYGLFVRSYNAIKEKDRVAAVVDAALANKEIDALQWLVLWSIDDYKKAVLELAYLKEKAEKKAQQNLMQMEQMKQANLKELHGFKMEEIQGEGAWHIEVAKIMTSGAVQGKTLEKEAKVETTNSKLQAEPQKQSAKEQAAAELETHKSNLKNQEALQTA